MRSLFFIICLFSFFISQAQAPKMKRYKTNHKHAPVCHLHHSSNRHIVPRAASPRSTPNNPANFIMDYDTDTPANAIAAIEFAVEILSAGLSSTIPINVRVNWGTDDIESTTYAFARPSEYIINLPNSREKVGYPIALAEKLARLPINGETEPDIFVTFNRNQRWYYGFDNPEGIRNDQVDLVTVALHEIMHGLGFAGRAFVSEADTRGYLRFDFDTNRLDKNGAPVIFDAYMTNNAGRNLLRTYEPQSTRLGNALLSNNVYIKTPQYEISTAPRLYAPTSADAGSSFSHLNLTTYSDTDDALMVPFLSRGTVIHTLGISLDILHGIGWSSTHLLHQGVAFEEDLNKPLVITANVNSDLGYDANSVTLYYSQDTFKTVDTISMTPTSQPDQYTYTIEATGDTENYQYYFTLIDSRNITLPFPQEGPDPLFFETFYGDNNLPIVEHTPLTSIDDKTLQFPIEAVATDFYKGIDSVYVEYFINGVLQPSVRLSIDTTIAFRDSVYTGVISLNESLSAADTLEYRIVAVDKNTPGNIRYVPADGRYPIEIKMTFEAVITYINDFDENRDDFDGNGFSIDQPMRFDNKGIQTEHPYENAAERGSLNFTYTLNRPIILKERNALIEFDEIVLVEPGEANTAYTDERFWDYVIVEGKKNGEAEWLPFLDGYDSREQSAWLAAFVRGQVGGPSDNSVAIGLPSLWRPRTIDMLENGNFFPGEIVDVRFRLFSDPMLWGWGWAVDNLRIQDPTIAVEDYLNQEDFTLSPNPSTTSYIVVEANFKKAVNNLQIHIYDNVGRLLVTKSINATSGQIKEAIDVDNLTSGIYFVNMRLDGVEQISRKIVIE